MIPKEIIFEIYSYLGNTDKRKLRQTSRQYDMKFKEKDILEELIEDGYDIPTHWIKAYYFSLIVKHGRLDIIKIINIRYLCDFAAYYGQLNILMWACENNYHWDRLTCAHAARGHLECLKFLHKHGCPWDKLTCQTAANGHLECLKYAYEHGCPWVKNMCLDAAEEHTACLNYINTW